MSYDEREYWNRRVCPNSMDVGDISDVITYFRDRIPYNGTVLDFGAGIGRMFPAFVDASEVVAVELSRPYIGRLMEAAKSYAFDFSIVLPNTPQVPHFLRKFDVAVASMVLLHTRPEIIGDVMTGLAKAADEVMVLTWATDRQTPNLAEHCFNHDYKQICQTLGFRVADWEQDGERLLFCYALS